MSMQPNNKNISQCWGTKNHRRYWGGTDNREQKT